MKQPAIRLLARKWRDELAGSLALDADRLLDLALADAGLAAQPVPSEDPLLAGAYAVLDRDLAHIWYDASLADTTRRFSLAHELAHWKLHDVAGPCGEGQIDDAPLENPLPFGESYLQGYSPAQRREVEANLFAAEFLAPGPILRKSFEAGRIPADIAEELGVSEGTVLGQMADCLLAPVTTSTNSKSEPSPVSLADLDPSQRAAAETETGPTLVMAGPGTGKTRTLIGRIEHLLRSGVRPDQILALTFSNRAANEMRERLEQTVPVAARKIWIGTFHSFGLELLRRFGDRIGLPPSPQLLDPLDAIALMERRLADLDLEEYEFLHDPTLPMRDILGAISRAKDELKTPADYAEMAGRMSAAAADEESRGEARKAAEVGRVYRAWESILREEGLIDFGDLLTRTVELLRAHPDVRDQLRREFRHILVDEYQDINRASAVLVKQLAGEGAGLWLVGDLRQAIYRFRGASPANVGAFEQDYPGGKRITLEVNYRSRPQLVGLFSSVAGSLGQAVEGGWSANREETRPRIVFAEAVDEHAQADHIAQEIEGFRATGIPYREQAILCRTHRQAELLGWMLEERGIPVVYLGGLLSRPEVKDLLSLLSLACEGPHALRRVAQFPEYGIDADVVGQIEAQAQTSGLLGALKNAADGGDAGAKRLYEHLEPIAFVGDAYAFLTRYLFGPASYLRRLLASDSAQDRQKVVAIRQLLVFAKGFRPPESSTEHPQRAFLNYVRRLLATGEETRAAVPADLDAIDGVRLTTAHAAKGLEFPVVFLPNLVQGMFPPRSRGGMVTLPPGLADPSGSEDEEEARLFFVALTRARDHLVLSVPKTTRGKPNRASGLLGLLRQPLSDLGAEIEFWDRSRIEEAGVESAVPPPLSGPIPLSAVEAYLRCPRQYFYRHLAHAASPERERGYRVFVDAANRLLRWHEQERSVGNTPSPSDIDSRLEEIWVGSGLEQQPHAALYRRRLLAIRENIEAAQSQSTEEWTAALTEGAIALSPDGVREGESGEIVVEKRHLGRESDTHRTAPVLSVLRLAATQREARRVKVVNRYLATGEEREVPPSPRYEPARLEKYERALLGIREETYEPSPTDPNECNRCPFFLVCPY